jgi:hypothetical protein
MMKVENFSYKYYMTKLGRRVLVTSLILREWFVLPTLAKNAL